MIFSRGRRVGASVSGRSPFRRLTVPQTGGTPPSWLAPFRHLPISQTGGIILPAFIIFGVISSLLILSFSRMALERNRQSVENLRSARGKALADAGVQLAMARLDWRIDQIPTRIAPDTEDPPRWSEINEEDVALYLANPAEFWARRLNGYDPGGTGVHPDFQLDARTAFFDLQEPNSPYRVRLTLRDASTAVGPALETGGINDFTLRYAFRIESTEIATGRKTVVESYAADPTDVGETIQLHLRRPLSQFNLFAYNNTTPPPSVPSPVFDRNRYRGKVYSFTPFYGAGDPWYDSTVQISRLARAPERYRFLLEDGGARVLQPFEVNYPWLKSDGATAAELRLDAPEETWPTSIQEDRQRRIAYTGDPEDPGPPALPGAPVLRRHLKSFVLKNGGARDTHAYIYIRGDATIVIENEAPARRRNLYRITVPALGAAPQPLIEQEVADVRDPAMLIFVDGTARVRGELSDGNKVTIAARDNLIVDGSLTYADTYPNDDTVLGLVSWNGNVLIAKDFADEPYRKVYAVIMAAAGGVGAEGWERWVPSHPAYDPAYNVDYPLDGTGSGVKGMVYHAGAIIRRWAIPTLSEDMKRGWGFQTEYDGDLADKKAPPFFPANGPFQLFEIKNAYVKDRFRVR